MNEKQRIIKTLNTHGLLSTSEIAEYSGIPFNECENALIELEDVAEVVAIGDSEWQLM